jgi:hypothetical protein
VFVNFATGEGDIILAYREKQFLEVRAGEVSLTLLV